MDHDDHDDGRAGGGTGTGLPASTEAAWGLRERPSRGPKPGLSLERIVAAGIQVARSEGLAAVSMHRVAAELGTSAMSLYRYVGAKDELLALMVDAAIGPPPPAPAGEGWRAGLSRWAWAIRAVYSQHTWALRVPIGGPPDLPNQVRWMEAGLRCMRDTSLGEGEKLSVILLLSGFVRSEVTLTADLTDAAIASRSTIEERMSGYGRLLRRVTDPERFPALSAAIQAGVLDDADDPDTEFIFGLERILDGVEALMRTRAPRG